MTPAERDEVRVIADRHLAYHPGGLATCTDCLNARAILRYVPAGDVPVPEAINVAIVAGDVTRMFYGPTPDAAPDFLRWSAHALHAAADAAEEK